jgi:tetratricopeptide (TPR) repeat protein
MQIAYYLHPSSVVVTREMAGFYEYFGDDARAINYYKLIPPTASMYNLAKTRIAFSNYKLGHKQEAKASLLKIIKEKHLNAARIILAEIYVQEFAYLKAASMYKAIADSSYSADAIVYELIGDCYSLAKDYVSAEEYWNQALSLKPNQAIILNKLGYVSLLANGDVMRASALVKRALELDPNDAAIIDSYGFALYMQGRYQESLVYLERAAKILPSSYEVIEHLGNSYFKLGRVSEAERYWQIALDIFVMQVQQKIVQDDVEYIQKLEEQIKEGI